MKTELSDTTTTAARYDGAIDRLLETAPNYGPYYSNHGPMAVEALEHLAEQFAMSETAIDDFTTGYLPKLVAKPRDAVEPADWRTTVRVALRDLSRRAPAAAGHGLLRLAHAVRAMHRLPSEVRGADIDEAIRYWQAADCAPTPDGLAGHLGVRDAAQGLGQPGPNNNALGTARGFLEGETVVSAAVASLGAPADTVAFFDTLAMEAAARFLHVGGESDRFALIHAVTVPTMAAELVPHLDDDSRRHLEVGVATFVLAVLGATETATGFVAPAGTAGPSPALLAREAATSLEEHTIKFTDATITLHRRTGSPLPLLAAASRLAE